MILVGLSPVLALQESIHVRHLLLLDEACFAMMPWIPYKFIRE